MPDMNEMQEMIARNKELQSLEKNAAPERHVSTTDAICLSQSHQHYFGDRTPGQVHATLDSVQAELAEAYAEIERLKTKAYHSSGRTWSDMAIQDRSQRAHTSGLLRLLVYCASGTQEDPDGWEIDCRRADYIKASLPRNPNAALEIARIVGVDRAFLREPKEKDILQYLNRVLYAVESLAARQETPQLAAKRACAEVKAIMDGKQNHSIQVSPPEVSASLK